MEKTRLARVTAYLTHLAGKSAVKKLKSDLYRYGWASVAAMSPELVEGLHHYGIDPIKGVIEHASCSILGFCGDNGRPKATPRRQRADPSSTMGDGPPPPRCGSHPLRPHPRA